MALVDIPYSASSNHQHMFFFITDEGESGNGIAPRILDSNATRKCPFKPSLARMPQLLTISNLQKKNKKYHEGLHKVKGRVRGVSICIIIPTVVNSVHLRSRVVARAGICLYYMWV
jgi:hypothetical protein